MRPTAVVPSPRRQVGCRHRLVPALVAADDRRADDSAGRASLRPHLRTGEAGHPSSQLTIVDMVVAALSSALRRSAEMGEAITARGGTGRLTAGWRARADRLRRPGDHGRRVGRGNCRVVPHQRAPCEIARRQPRRPCRTGRRRWSVESDQAGTTSPLPCVTARSKRSAASAQLTTFHHALTWSGLRSGSRGRRRAPTCRA